MEISSSSLLSVLFHNHRHVPDLVSPHSSPDFAEDFGGFSRIKTPLKNGIILLGRIMFLQVISLHAYIYKHIFMYTYIGYVYIISLHTHIDKRINRNQRLYLHYFTIDMEQNGYPFVL